MVAMAIMIWFENFSHVSGAMLMGLSLALMMVLYARRQIRQIGLAAGVAVLGSGLPLANGWVIIGACVVFACYFLASPRDNDA